MRYRKLRVAWSVVWGLAAVLLVVLWVRISWWLDSLQFRTGRCPTTCCIQCYTGGVTAFSFNDPATPRFDLKSTLMVGQVARDVSSITA
jgi:hypothetical protein